MSKRECVGIQWTDGGGKPDYYPESIKEAKQQLINECKGKTDIRQIMGLHFRFIWLLNDKEHNQWEKFVTNICNEELKK